MNALPYAADTLSLTERLGQLHATLEELGTDFREQIARAISTAVAQAVHQTLCQLLSVPPNPGIPADPFEDLDSDDCPWDDREPADSDLVPSCPQIEPAPSPWLQAVHSARCHPRRIGQGSQ